MEDQVSRSRGPQLRQFGAFLQERRKAAGLTQEKAAEAIGTSQPSISLWESGKVAPTASSLYRISVVYRIPAEELLGRAAAELDEAVA